MKIHDPKNPNGLTIALVEDSELQSQALSSILAKIGFRVLSFLKLDEAKTYYVEHADEIALVLCDGTLQTDCDGVVWAEELQLQERNVLLFWNGSYSGPAPYLRKTVHDEILLDTIEAMTSQTV